MEMFKTNNEKIHIESYEDGRDVTSVHNELIQVLDRFFYTISRVNLQQDTMCLLQCTGHPEAISQVLSWTDYLSQTSSLYIEGQREQVRENFSSQHLLKLYEDGENFYSMDASFVKNGELNSMTLIAFLASYKDIPHAYIMVHNATRENLRKRIIDMYVYDKCDYFLYLDAKNNSYTMFGKTAENLQPLPVYCDDYLKEMLNYVDKSVVEEDRERVRKEVQIDRILSRLDQKEVNSFSCGVMDETRGYTRKRIEYRYYERSTQMILLSSTDVTEIYEEEQEHCKVLAEALRRAQTDVLTGILNYQGIVEQVSNSLKEQPEHAALLFADLDNFKQINDSLGHAAGDQVLRKVAEILQNETKREAMIGRFGGDEFIIYFPNIESIEEVKSYAQGVCDSVRGLEYGQEKGVNVSCSIGIIEIPKYGYKYKDLLQKADDMLYRAKSRGKNQFVIYAE